ncbi:hypothetical protein PHYSODRAFT_555774 [Phytophthora sojae]|uniref:Storage protein LPV n=1 Tax=Phytophthora sojae (strain P6497) TaxID=1094619 RepID=G4YTD4_PHYSP|nr:hypothetical protein PHYSODRAFT_555774 [Phytophthora sojae]EGZ23056.1 hypothetical protein PHYSODRAFT_555774 [Phytophthora sojae]|eukprot:XP_009518344.1 hypothetical protein PHYSODRAFT_555774 [Phytophthora sojae]
MTVVTVPEVPAEIAEIATEDTQVVNVVTPSGEQQQVVIEGEPEHGEVTIELVDEHGEVTTEEVKAVETDEGIKLVVPTDDGYVPVVVPEIPEEIQQEIIEEAPEEPILSGYFPELSGENPFTEEETPVVQTVDVVADNGEQQQVILVGGIEDGTQTIEVLNDFGGYTETEVKAIETPEGEKLVVPDAEGDMTVVTVPEVPAEIAEIATEDTQVVNVVTPSGEQQQVVIEGEPEHGEVTIELVDEHGEVTTEEVKAVETDEGIKLVVPTDDGYVPVVVPEIPEEIQQEIIEEAPEEPILSGYFPELSGENPFTEEETPVVQTVDVVADNGEQQQVILVGGIEDGTQTIEVLNDFGGYTETEVKAIETPEGEKLVVPDAEGDMTVVTVPEVPAEIAEIATEDTQVVNVVTPSGEQQQVVIEGEPEHGEVTIELVDEHGEVTTEEVKAVETDEGIKLVVPTDDGYVPVVVPEIPEEIQQEIIEEAPEEPMTGLEGSKFMTKDEFREWISKRYQDKISEMMEQEQRLEEEEAAKASRVKQLEGCIEQAANKFGYYGVYEQPPHYQNAVDWVENECWANQWEPEAPAEHPMLRR